MKRRAFKLNKMMFLHIACCLAVMAAACAGTGEYNMIHVCGDEFGYWGNAAHFTGRDWSGLIAVQSYYSFGYSLLLVPLFWLGCPMSGAYKLALILNAAILAAAYGISYQVCRKLFADIPRGACSLICCTVALYPSGLVYAKTTFCETLLLLLFWLGIWLCMQVERLCMQLERKKKPYLLLLFLGVNGYAFWVHQRSLGVLIASVAVAGCMLLTGEAGGRRNIVLGLAGLFVIVAAGFLIKSRLIGALWDNGTNVSYNNFSGQSSKLMSLLGPEGIRNLGESLSGKLFYFLSTTFLLGGFGIWYLLERFLQLMRGKRERGEYDVSLLYMLLSFLMNLGIASVFLIYSERKDILIYGRYTEALLGPLILLGLARLYQERVGLKEILAQLLVYLISVLAVHHRMERLVDTPLVSLTTVGVYPFLSGFQDTGEGILLLAGAVVSAVLLLYRLRSLSRGSGRKAQACFAAVLLLCAGAWLYEARYVAGETLDTSHASYNEGILPVAGRLLSDPDLGEKELYYVIQDRAISPSDYNDTNIDRLQFCLADYPVRMKEASEVKGDIREGTYYIVLGYSPMYDEFKAGNPVSPVIETRLFGVFEKQGQPHAKPGGRRGKERGEQ